MPDRGIIMELNINHELRIESKIPFQSVKDFSFEWKPNQLTTLEINGYIDQNITYGKESFYDSKIRIWKEQDKETIFCGYITNVSEEKTGSFIEVHLIAQSASCKLDQKTEKRSFQAVEKTYAQIVREAVQQDGGQIICTEGNNSPIGKPLIQYNETAWEFSKRLASRLTTCIVADIISGEPALWFGMRNGNTIPPLPEDEYTINIVRAPHGDGSQTETEYQAESREFYKLGDKTVFCGRKLIICGVSANFQHGELIFRYLLKNKVICKKIYQENLIGLGLSGTVVDVRQEQIKVALDIDGGKSTGDYFYNWYPETGNALYAMPEIGARVEVCFGSWDEKDGFGINCFLKNKKERNSYLCRQFHTSRKSSINLYTDNISFFNGYQYSFSISDNYMSLSGLQKLSIGAKDGIHIDSEKIIIRTPSDLNFCKN